MIIVFIRGEKRSAQGSDLLPKYLGRMKVSARISVIAMESRFSYRAVGTFHLGFNALSLYVVQQ